MTDYLHIQLPPDQIRGISSIGLAHMGDAVYELLVRTWLCAHGKATGKGLHRATVALVCAPKQAELAQRILLELKDKLGDAAPAEGGISLPAGDVPAASGSALALAQAALAELGYRPQDITAALRSFDPEGMKTEEIVRQCLRAMVMR